MSHLLRPFLVGGLMTSAILMTAAESGQHETNLLALLHFVLFAVGLALYLVPTWLALYRGCKSIWWIAAVNVLLGWTIFGWFIAAGWAASGMVRIPTIKTGGSPAHAHH